MENVFVARNSLDHTKGDILYYRYVSPSVERWVEGMGKQIDHQIKEFVFRGWRQMVKNYLLHLRGLW